MIMLDLLLTYLAIGTVYAFLDLIYEHYFNNLENEMGDRYYDVMAGIVLIVIITWPIWLTYNIIKIIVKVILG